MNFPHWLWILNVPEWAPTGFFAGEEPDTLVPAPQGWGIADPRLARIEFWFGEQEYAGKLCVRVDREEGGWSQPQLQMEGEVPHGVPQLPDLLSLARQYFRNGYEIHPVLMAMVSNESFRVEALHSDEGVSGVDLGDATVNRQVRGLMAGLRQGQLRYRVRWNGSKCPRGCIVRSGLDPIAWAQHGMLTSQKGKMIGSYERVVEFGGASKDEQEIIAYVDPPREQAP